MTVSFEPEISGRLQRALAAFQKTQGMLLTAHRKLKNLVIAHGLDEVPAEAPS